MSDLGLLLKKARIQKGITLDELQEITKIQKRYLEAIEEGNFQVLPGNFYVRAFIKSYSEAVGLNPDEVLRLYRDVIPATPKASVEPIRQKRKRRFNSDQFSKWLTTLLLWCFPLIILVLLYIYINYIHEPNPIDANQNVRITDEFEAVDEPPDSIVVVPPDDE